MVLADIERVRHASSKDDTLRLSVVYNFWVNDDGPYGGEGFWTPAFSIGAVKRRGKQGGNFMSVRPLPSGTIPTIPALTNCTVVFGSKSSDLVVSVMAMFQQLTISS